MLAGLDFETFGTRDLPKVGLHNYIADPHFKPLLASLAFENHDEEFDFVLDPDAHKRFSHYMTHTVTLGVAHNAGFEIAVLNRMGIRPPQMVDSAVVARYNGAESSLENSASQLLGKQKDPEGKRLIKKFSIGDKPPGEEVADDPDWLLFKKYCTLDARLGYQIVTDWQRPSPLNTWSFEITQRMNELGWPVDVASVQEMLRRYEENCQILEAQFRKNWDPKGELNLGSTTQLRAWCLERGVRTTSFDEEHVTTLLERVRKKLATRSSLTLEQVINYTAVLELLETKRALGGSSLKKLEVILRMVGEDGRLYDAYMHAGAGQTMRTTGRGAQLQNLPRITNKRDMNTLKDPGSLWLNEDLSANIRQLFTASNPAGDLIVGDLASIESRGLAYLAGEHTKLEAFANDLDVYKVLAQQIHGVHYDQVTPDQRRSGKVGELGCGYGAGGEAVAAFAKTMGIPLSVAEAGELVQRWRQVNPAIVTLWDKLNDALHRVVVDGLAVSYVTLDNDLEIRFIRSKTPTTVPSGRTNVEMSLLYRDTRQFSRYFVGCYSAGRNIRYMKAAARADVDWLEGFTDPKTKKWRYYELYGGKLAGILTQSFCREIFFSMMRSLDNALPKGAELIGQFHDEVIVDYDPTLCAYPREYVVAVVKSNLMTSVYAGLPLAAEVKYDYRYNK